MGLLMRSLLMKTHGTIFAATSATLMVAALVETTARTHTAQKKASLLLQAEMSSSVLILAAHTILTTATSGSRSDGTSSTSGSRIQCRRLQQTGRLRSRIILLRFQLDQQRP